MSTDVWRGTLGKTLTYLSVAIRVSAVAAHKGRVIREVFSSDPLDAQGMGYARSKWVTENLAAKAAATRGIRAESFRIGQMVGDTQNGVWNETEAISLLVKSAQTIGAMPDLREVSTYRCFPEARHC